MIFFQWSAQRASARPVTAWVFATLLIAVILLAANYPLVRGSAAGIWDTRDLFEPTYMLIAEYARAGRWLDWNPWSDGGAPTYADPQLGALSPLTVGMGCILGGTGASYVAYWLLLWILAAAGTMLLARHLGAPLWGACVAALGFVAGGVFTGHAEHVPVLESTAFLPWILWRLDHALRTGRLRPAVEAGALWGLSALAGYPGLTILTGLFSGLWSLGRWLCPESAGNPEGTEAPAGKRIASRMGRMMFSLLVPSLMGLTGLVVLAPAFGAFFVETQGYCDRVHGLAREAALGSNALEPWALCTFASPYLAILKLWNPQLWPETDVSTCNCYLGAGTLVLAMLALLAQPRSAWRWYLAGLGALFLAFAVGPALPVRGWLYDWLPPTRYFRHAGMFRIYTMQCLIVLALLGSRDLAAAISMRCRKTWVLFGLAAAMTAAGATLAMIAVLTELKDIAIDDACLLAGGDFMLIWASPLALAALGCRLARSPRVRVVTALLVGLAAVDAALAIRLSEPAMYSEQARRTWNTFEQARIRSLDLTPNGLTRYACLSPSYSLGNMHLVTKSPVLQSYNTLTNSLRFDLSSHPVLLDMATGPRRFWFARTAQMVAPTLECYQEFVQRAEFLKQPPLVIHARADLLNQQPSPVPAAEDRVKADISLLPSAERVDVQLLRYVPDELSFEVECPADGWLLVTDRWAPGWRARVNGVATDVLGGNFLFRALPVRSGLNRVTFSYHPFGLPLLVILSWGTLGVVLAWRPVSKSWHRLAIRQAGFVEK
jgi:hypothetical protein